MWWSLGAVGGFLVWWGLASARRALYPPAHAVPHVHTLSPETRHTVVAPDGTSFDIWLLAPPAARARLLLCHGYFANRNQVVDIGWQLWARGYEVVIVEMRGHGDRPGPCTLGVREAEDAQAALVWARRRDGAHPLPVGVLGLSMGAAVACHVALRDAHVKAVVADSVYGRLFPVLQRVLRQYYHLPAFPWAWLTWWSVELALRTRLAAYDPVTLAPHLRQPLLALHGGQDHRVAPSLGEAFYRQWAGPRERWGEPAAGHVGLFVAHPEEYIARVAGFFDRILR